MIDLHSHVLPKMDDGSSCPAESIQMLRESYRQGVEIMVATPHFYAHRDDPARFLERRANSFSEIEPDSELMPELLLGAEVSYFDGLSRSEELYDLRIGQSELLLIEMPFFGWTKRVVEDICSVRSRLGLTPVLAHVERYLDKNDFPRFSDTLLDAGVYFQCNAEFFKGGFGGIRAMNMVKNDRVHFLGSDCHNMTRRPPNLGGAVERIGKKFGSQTLQEMDAFALRMLGLDDGDR